MTGSDAQLLGEHWLAPLIMRPEHPPAANTPGEDSAVAHGEVMTAQPIEPGAGEYPHVPPPRVSSDPNHRDFHPSARRIGVIVNGERRKDCCWYDAPAGMWRSIDGGRHGKPRPGQVVVFWLWQETRQERRARERWDAKHGPR